MKKLYSGDVVERVTMGVSKLAEIVSPTMGGKGKNVILEGEFGEIKIINDGTTIADAIELQDPMENAGVKLAKLVAAKTNSEGGDGTTTSIVLLQSLLNNLEAKIKEKKVKDPRGLRESVQKIVDEVVEKLTAQSRKVKANEIEKVAYISCLDKDMAQYVKKLIKKVGSNGVVDIQEATTNTTKLEIVKGINIKKGYITRLLATDKNTLKSEIIDTPVLVTRKKIETAQDIMGIMQELAAKQTPRMVIFAEELSEEVASMVVVNKMEGAFLTNIVQTDDLDDIAIATNATVVEDNDTFTRDKLGMASRVTSTKYDTTVIGTATDEQIEEAVKMLKEQKKATEIPYEKRKCDIRIARLTGGVAVVKVGGESKQEAYEKKLKLEDAVNAVKAAKEHGVIEGGGLPLYRIAKEFTERLEEYRSDYGGYCHTETQDLAYQIVINTIKQPYFQILINGEVTDVEKVLEESGEKGYNVITGEMEDFSETGVLDPLKVTCSALKNAFATGLQIATVTGAVVVENEENK